MKIRDIDFLAWNLCALNILIRNGSHLSYYYNPLLTTDNDGDDIDNICDNDDVGGNVENDDDVDVYDDNVDDTVVGVDDDQNNFFLNCSFPLLNYDEKPAAASTTTTATTSSSIRLILSTINFSFKRRCSFLDKKRH